MSYLEYIENPFKACSDEWADRSLINSLIWTTSLEIESKNETIKLHERQIQSDKDKLELYWTLNHEIVQHA